MTTTATVDKEYITAAETARYIRATLKLQFPGVKFSVVTEHRSSVRIGWQDGPTIAAVDAVTDPFEGGRFDGMIDLAYPVSSWLLPDGSAVLGRSCGSGGGAGSDEPYSYPAPCEGARMVNFGARYIFTNRSYSEDFARQIRDELATKWSRADGDFPEIRSDRSVSWYLDWEHPAGGCMNNGPGGCNPRQLFRDAAEAEA